MINNNKVINRKRTNKYLTQIALVIIRVLIKKSNSHNRLYRLIKSKCINTKMFNSKIYIRKIIKIVFTVNSK